MRIENSYRIIPCYSADVSGVCSALFELGGMTVMHDPSGCNSTYNTHDETRWYDHDSLIYITALTELDAIMGNDNKVVADICDAASRLHPKFIALCGSPIPYLNGFDFNAIAGIIERRTGICTFAVETNGTHDYIRGAGRALLRFSEKYMSPQWDSLYDKSAGRRGSRGHSSGSGHGSGSAAISGTAGVNILGATPLDFAVPGSITSISTALLQRGIHTLSCFAMDNRDTADLDNAVYADANLVVSAVGLPLAEYMLERYGIPYAVGIPIGGFAEKLCEDLKVLASGSRGSDSGRAISCGIRMPMRDTAASRTGTPAALSGGTPGKGPGTSAALIGEAVAMGSLASAISLRYGISTSVLCPLEASNDLLTPFDHTFKGEEQCAGLMEKFDHVVADPLYLSICPESAVFHRLPHAAFSGRCCMHEMTDLVKRFAV